LARLCRQPVLFFLGGCFCKEVIISSLVPLDAIYLSLVGQILDSLDLTLGLNFVLGKEGYVHASCNSREGEDNDPEVVTECGDDAKYREFYSGL